MEGLSLSDPLILTYATDSFFNFIYSTAGDQAGGFRHKFIDISLATFPMMNGHIADIAHVAKSSQW